ncbi:MAG: T3SS effector HopA1 family protein [Cytophagales bacterium]|nr:T3SS effector HopA1 family protein [Cytophagales bacterium]
MLYSRKVKGKKHPCSKQNEHCQSFLGFSPFQTAQQKTAGLAFPKSQPVQLKFKAAHSREHITAHPLEPRSNPVMQIAPMTLFLYEANQQLSSSEHIIGLPRGIFRTRNTIVETASSQTFNDMLNWLYSIWENLHSELMSNQEKRLKLQETIYNLALKRNSPCSFSRNTFLKGLSNAFENHPPHILCNWQFSTRPNFPARDILKHPDSDMPDSPFLSIVNPVKKQSVSAQPKYRLYLNTVPEHIHSMTKFLVDYVLLNEELPGTYTFKISNHSDLGARKDNLVIYSCAEGEVSKILEILQDFQKIHPAVFEDEVPALTQKAAKGIGFALTPPFGYNLNPEAIPFDYDTQKLNSLLSSVSASSDPAIRKFVQSPGTREILAEMEQKRAKSLLPEGRSEAVSLEKLEKLGQKYLDSTGSQFQELEQLREDLTFTRPPGVLEQTDFTSFLYLRSHLIAQALLDCLLTSKDPNLFICHVWNYFRQGKISFFNPQGNLEE